MSVYLIVGVILISKPVLYTSSIYMHGVTHIITALHVKLRMDIVKQLTGIYSYYNYKWMSNVAKCSKQLLYVPFVIIPL